AAAADLVAEHRAGDAARDHAEALCLAGFLYLMHCLDHPEHTGQPQISQAGVFGMVEAVHEVKEPGEAKGLGVVAGGVAGAVLGHQVGSGRGNKLATVLGAVGGAIAGNHLEKQARAEKRWEVTVRLDDGSTHAFSTPSEPVWRAGDRVRLHEGKLLSS
ncbi:MAG: glycine zipper 2TM domain-containing protein, partial [Betaproteobacteria bacterium]